MTDPARHDAHYDPALPTYAENAPAPERRVFVAGQRTVIEPPVVGTCWSCSTRLSLVAGYYGEGGKAAGAPWRPVCEGCDRRMFPAFLDGAPLFDDEPRCPSCGTVVLDGEPHEACAEPELVRRAAWGDR